MAGAYYGHGGEIMARKRKKAKRPADEYPRADKTPDPSDIVDRSMGGQSGKAFKGWHPDDV